MMARNRRARLAVLLFVTMLALAMLACGGDLSYQPGCYSLYPGCSATVEAIQVWQTAEASQ